MRLLPSFFLAAAVIAATPAPAHDLWISQFRLRNAAGEWCCGASDCVAIKAQDIQSSPVGYKLINGEIVPYSEVQPSMDGAYWRCMRPDGSRRCFFAPPSNS